MSDHPRFKELKKTQVQDLRPAVKEGFLTKRGGDVHSWKKRWFVMKDQYIYYFPKNTATSTPKGIIELDENSTAKLIETEKKPTIVIQSVHREQVMTADKVEDARAWIDAINNQIISFKKKSEPTVKKLDDTPKINNDANQPSASNTNENINSDNNNNNNNTNTNNDNTNDNNNTTPSDVLPWDQVKQKIESEEGEWTGDKIRNFMVNIGKSTCDEYLYTIMNCVLKNWDEEKIADFWWDDFCDGDLEDLSSVVAGQQGNGSVSLDVDGKPLGKDDTVFVLGRDEQGAKRLAKVYERVNNKMNFNWSEITRCILGAIANWGLKTSEPFFITFVNEIVKSWSASEIAAFVSYLSSYAKDNEEESWESWPPHVVDFFKLLCSGWDNDTKKSFMNIVIAMWDWKKESIQKLNEIINGTY